MNRYSFITSKNYISLKKKWLIDLVTFRLTFIQFGCALPKLLTQAQSMHWKMKQKIPFMWILVCMATLPNRISNPRKLWKTWRNSPENTMVTKVYMLRLSWPKRNSKTCLMGHITRKYVKVCHCAKKLFLKCMTKSANWAGNKLDFYCIFDFKNFSGL